MLAAGTNVEWLRDDLGMIATAEESDTVAARCADADGVVYVPALLGLGTPKWDFGARGTMLGVTRGTTRAHFVRAVLEGVAHRGADLVEAATIDSGLAVAAIRIDGGMSRNRTFTQALANATGRSIEISRAAEATTNGAAFIAGLATGVFPTIDAIADTWDPITVVEPNGSLDRDQWRRALERAGEWLPDLSALHF
jgi:glycerol kinase